MTDKNRNKKQSDENFALQNFFISILHIQRRRIKLLNLQSMGPPSRRECHGLIL